jgi:predicted nucleic acid-binding Zn ribbon protein
MRAEVNTQSAEAQEIIEELREHSKRVLARFMASISDNQPVGADGIRRCVICGAPVTSQRSNRIKYTCSKVCQYALKSRSHRETTRKQRADKPQTYCIVCGEPIIPDSKNRIGKTCNLKCRYIASADQAKETRNRNKNKED